MTKRRLVGGLLPVLGIAAAASILALSSTSSGAVAMHRVSTTCNKTTAYAAAYYTRQIDPITSPGAPTSAHLHNFFGTLPSASFSAGTYPLRAGHEDEGGYQPTSTNCKFYGDWPLGWYPVAKLNGADLTPGVLTHTWQAAVGSTVIAPPFGASFVSGSANATTAQPHVRFTCGDAGAYPGNSIDGPGSDKPTDCTGTPGGVVTGEITFPDCWDGLGASKPDPLKQWVFDAPYGISTSHFYYSTNGACPPGTTPCVQGRLMAQLVSMETWIDNRPASPDYLKPLRNPLNADGSMALSFSSGDYHTYHGDYINTWNHYLDLIVQSCLWPGAGPGTCPYGTTIGLHTLE